MKIWLLKDEGDFNNSTTAYRTKKAAIAALISIIKENWEDNMADLDAYDAPMMPTCSAKLVEEYYSAADWHNNYLSIEPVTLED